jgi:23S rRNA pseudouridine1911/1915/1917 synthase
MRGSEYGVEHWVVSDGSILLSEFLEQKQKRQGLVLVQASALIAIGALYVNGRRALADVPLRDGDHVRAHLQPRRFHCEIDLAKRIVEEHVDYYVVDKPGGLPSHALVDNRNENLLSLLTEALQERLYITHRLDVATSGLLLIARNSQAQAAINQLIRDHRIERTYWAWCTAAVPLGVHVHFMEPSPTAPKKVELHAQPGWLRCELNCLSATRVDRTDVPGFIENSEMSDSVYRLEIRLATGRSQQIRAQLSALGAPILGDQNYGSSIALTSYESECEFENVKKGAPVIGLRSQAIRFLDGDLDVKKPQLLAKCGLDGKNSK